MSIIIHIPTNMKALTKNQNQVTGHGASVMEVITNIDNTYPGLKERLVDNNNIPGYLNIYLNDEDIRFTNGLSSSVKSGDTIYVLPAVAGGWILNE